ncbi:MAG: CCA tRNA nucleotidyltransferase [Thermoplasmata archaeon]|nr:CCA tRNA nucleotidyltransferase [Thermoplasmata archaeon]
MELKKEILRKIVPSADEQRRIDKAVDDLIQTTKEIAESRNLSFKSLLVGSIAKGTHLTDPDIDLFLKFPTDVPVEEIGRIDKEIGREILEKPEERYAEHAYISGVWQGLRTDLVPCYDILSGRGKISAVDRTPFHTKYVQEYLRAHQKNEVRIFKQFLRGIGAYGAEAKIQGFSGYLCEIMILKFGGFDRVIAAAAKWKAQVRLQLDEEASRSFDEPFVFVDPVDPSRNVASPISIEKLDLFIRACRAYNKKPSLRFFFPKIRKAISDSALTKEISSFPGTVLLELPGLDVVDDVLWPQLRKTGVSVFEIFEREGFRPKKLTLDSDAGKNLIIVTCAVSDLPDRYVHIGPPKGSPEAENFLNKWRRRGISEPVLKKGRWQVEVERKERALKDVLLKQFSAIRLGKGFRQIKKPKISSGKDLMLKKYRKALTMHFDERMPWER